ncbi:MAG: hypothetical protein H0W02_20725, partial [Ktedonobacteraceae bacterium]|nr:hypothetical protein [Ktedonobacteraceae bacterium]
MTVDIQQGSPQFPTVAGNVASSMQDEMDTAVQTLQAHKGAWVALTVRERVAIIDQLIKDFVAIAPRWVAASLKAKGLTEDSPFVGEEWAAGVLPVVKNMRQLRQSLLDIEAHGQPVIPGTVRTRPDGQVVAPVFPQTGYDRLFFTGVTAEVWMEPGVTVAELPQTQARIYQDKN